MLCLKIFIFKHRLRSLAVTKPYKLNKRFIIVVIYKNSQTLLEIMEVYEGLMNGLNKTKKLNK